jgi:hypothetical protein
MEPEIAAYAIGASTTASANIAGSARARSFFNLEIVVMVRATCKY